MPAVDVADVQRTGTEIRVRFASEEQAVRIESALAVAFPQLEMPAVDPIPAIGIDHRIKSEWDDGFVLEIEATNNSAIATRLSLPLQIVATIEDVWGGSFKQAAGSALITSDKPIEPGETWDFGMKAKGSDHSFSLSPAVTTIEAEETETVGGSDGVSAPEPEPEPKASMPAPTPDATSYAPALDPGQDAKRNILDLLGGVYDGGWEWENIEVMQDSEGPYLRTHMGEGLYVGDKGKQRGAGFDTRTLHAEHAILEYDLRLKPGFDPVKGGKLPGLMAGDSPSGHKEADNGITARIMWRRDAQGELYLYYPEMEKSYGDSIGRGSFTFDTSGAWHTIRQEVKLNDVGQSNGFIRVWYDDRLAIERTGLRLRTKDSVLIEGMMHTIFFGGGDRSWAASRDEYVDTRNFRISTP
ncbi:polysaccharide lyase [Litchfieldella xinjiangensis]|uniref:polysaccharide lyase n=1 Tax=Litchfieldella xinjiangensis TaxID=1166948 RepID=UPI000694FD28|nr:hypothetical protein [Halomonas xinjiangensis]